MGHILKFNTSTAAPREVKPRTFRFTASTAEVDREGDVIEPTAWKLDGFMRNPVILAAHNRMSLPVARAATVAVEGGHLMVDVQFPAPGTSAASDEAYGLVSQGFLRAVSVGFI